MNVKVRDISAASDDSDLVLPISRIANVSVLRDKISSLWEIDRTMLKLFYKGKQLRDEYLITDYNILPNDVLQVLIVKYKETENGASIKNDKTSRAKTIIQETSISDDELDDAKSNYYRIGDRIDIQDEHHSVWFEYVIKSIKRNCEDEVGSSNGIEKDRMFFAVCERESEQAPFKAKFDEIRPRARYTYRFSELSVGQTVLVNYNIEEPNTRGYWYDMCIDQISDSPKSVIGTIKFKKGFLSNCKIKFYNEIMKIEHPKLHGNKMKRTVEAPIPLRKTQYFCVECKDNKNKKCKDCGCGICGGKSDPSTIILCDECDTGYHLACLDPPLTQIPEEPEWYCPECKTDENEIIKANDELRIKNKNANKLSKHKRKWGLGMQSFGRTKECTIVPKTHYGPVPGIEVGTCWKFRVQLSEAGIHRPSVAGIHGRENDGAYSLVFSGAYEDDFDNGEEFWYTGTGGRDFTVNKRIIDQSSNQTLTRMNKALALNCNAPFSEKGADAKKAWKAGRPVRVVRNYKARKHSEYAPLEGNRYDGIYKVVKYCPEKDISGFIVWRYLLRRDDPSPPPWKNKGKKLEVIYPQGYPETQNDTADCSRKRGNSETDSQQMKKQKLPSFKLPNNINNLISKDTANQKLWAECKEFSLFGQLKYLTKVQDVFMCICCQEVVYKPITTECKHNICLSCLKRSFSSEIYTCPYCRFNFGPNYKMTVNKNLSEALLQLFPGYRTGR